jgi:two-component system, chemotaxis family, CheB/CheR fusion protein
MHDPKRNPRIVGIGASAGAMDPLKEFFTRIGAETGLAFVVVQHLDPNHVSYMSEVLARQTGMKVIEATDRAPVQANLVYTIPPNKFISIDEGVLHLSEPIKRDGLRLPIDFFFRSLAHDRGADAIAVLLSGGGSDGTLGIREIRGAGGLVIVQNPETAQFDSMIESAIATGQVDFVLPVQEIPAKLFQYVRQVSEHDGATPQTISDGIEAILELLVNETKSDFRCYKKTTVQRRIERRMGVNRIQDISAYHTFLRENPAEMAKLAKDMLIGVTSFFRDPEAFAELRDKVIRPLVHESNRTSPLRAWIAGCATGEEAYSIAILVMEEMAAARKNLSLQMFASDIDSDALKSAREGIYPQSIAGDVNEERLARFFIKRDSIYQIEPRIRECMTFAEHNVIQDPPFLRMDLISCRNLMIYIEPEIQQKILNLFAFALKPDRYLFLGKADTSTDQNDLFEPVSRSWRIFQRRPSAAVPFRSFPIRTAGQAIKSDEQHPIKLADLNQQALLDHFNASMVLVRQNGEILHFYGATDKYLSHPSGDATLNLFSMIEKHQAVALRLAVDRAEREDVPVTSQLREINRNDPSELVKLTVKPVKDPISRQRLIAVIFQPAEPQPTAEPVTRQATKSQDGDIATELEAENDRLKQDLQTALETFQVTHEEFTAANEEVLAINEELQATNEELETSKEELQSVNEELVTVNNQLNEKVEDLSKANDDLANFLNSSDVATLFLDRGFCIRRFTASATRLMKLLSLDIGRPIGDIANQLIDVDLTSVADAVLKNLATYEQEVAAANGSWHMMRCVPYRTLNDVIDGVVFTFTDVTRLKQSEEAMRRARDYTDNIIQTVPVSLLVLDAKLKVICANQAFYRTFQVAREETEHRLIYELGRGQWDIPRLRELLEVIAQRDSHIDNFEVEHDFPDIGRKIMSVNARKLSSNHGDNGNSILLAIEDITGRRQAEAERLWLEGELRQAQKMESLGTLAAGIAHDFNNILNIVQGYAFVLRDSKISDELVTESVAAILDSTTRGATIVQQLLTLARKTEPKFELVNIVDLVEELAQLFGKSSSQTIEIKLELGRQMPAVLVDRNQIFQALLNLCLNARDAMPSGGTLSLKTSLVNGNAVRNTVPSSEEVTAERYVRIDVNDTGEGIDEKVLGRIFEPFFTTKGAGRGTGLGLAVVYGILQHHKGLIQVTSKPGAGTSFQIYLPVMRRTD